jgi:hypothetical protein
MNLESTLTSVPADQWKVSLSIIFDWYDGPRQGICRLAQPAVEFSFELIDERFSPDGPDDRLFRLSEIPAGSVEAVLSGLQNLGHPTGPYWVPIWRFPSEEERQGAEALVKQVQQARRPTSLVLSTRDMVEFLGCWKVPTGERPTGGWFAALNLAGHQTA